MRERVSPARAVTSFLPGFCSRAASLFLLVFTLLQTGFNLGAATIASLRSLVDTNTWLVTDTNTLWSITGVITTFTNITSGNTASYYLQDATAGINLFVSGGSGFRPAPGDQVTAVGSLLSFNSNLELLVNTNNPSTYAVIDSHNNTVPNPLTIDPLLTNNIAAAEQLEGSLVMLTNVYFTNTAPLPAANTTVTVTNSAGVPFQIFFPNGVDLDSRGKVLPGFAYSVSGPLASYWVTQLSPVTQVTTSL